MIHSCSVVLCALPVFRGLVLHDSVDAKRSADNAVAALDGMPTNSSNKMRDSFRRYERVDFCFSVRCGAKENPNPQRTVL